MPAQVDPKYMHRLGRHFVALSCRAKAPDATDEGQYFSASGFIISIYGVWFLLTAGHIFSDIAELEAKGWRFVNWQLDDTFALAEKRPVFVDGSGAPETIPFGFDTATKKAYFDEEAGIDYAFIYIDRYYEKLLRANGVLPFEEKHWVINEERVAEKVELLGLPADQITELQFRLVQKTLVALRVCARMER